MDLISSRTNQKIKAARALRRRKNRQEQGLFLVEGIRHVAEAIEAGAPLTAIYYAPEILESPFALELVAQAEQGGLPCYALSVDAFNSLAEKDNPQGLLAVARTPVRRLDEFDPLTFPWGVALISPQDPGNLGSILRTLDAVGAAGLVVLDGGVEHTHPAAVRASMGALFWRPVVYAAYDDFLAWARQWGYSIYGTSAGAALDYRQVSAYSRPCILLMGSERDGLSAGQADDCHEVIRLPMHGRATSLNLSVATGVMLYEMLDKLQG